MKRNLMMFDPFQEITQSWDDDFLSTGSKMNVDVYQDKDNVIVETEIPGVKSEDVDITVENDVLTISGNKQEKKEVKREDYYRKEMRCGSFSRSVILPMQVKSSEAKANFKDGVLKITLPKADEIKSKKIKIETNKK
jgi:HSP20 family protein